MYINDIGKELLENRRLFLSKRAVQSFGGYADQQLRRLQNALARDSYPQAEKEIFMDVTLSHYPLRDYRSIWAEMHNIVKDYDKIGKRNKKKDDDHLNKHAMHLIRLFMMAIDILEKQEIITCREAGHTLLMDIRNGRYQKADGTYREEFYDMLRKYEQRLAYAAEHTSLPEEPDYRRVEEFMMHINERVVRDEI